MTENHQLYLKTHAIELPSIYDILIELRKERKKLIYSFYSKDLFFHDKILLCNTFHKKSIFWVKILHCLNTMQL